ncbi:HAD family hydrolase [Herbaspirillum robiniae]|uniref:HAD family hydrolase n=1 Tax=Herbaspirillum robiniae TaxID=2014887 RepID=UPI003D7809B0
MVGLIIFDLDNTLVASNAIEHLRGPGYINNESAEYASQIAAALKLNFPDLLAPVKKLIPEDFILGLKADIPDLKIAVLSIAPRHYVRTILAHRYPNIQWDAIVGYEDVPSGEHKPHPAGIFLAGEMCGCMQLDPHQVMIVGDSYRDVTAGYRAGIRTVLFTGGWEDTDYQAINLLPDAHVKSLDNLKAAILFPEQKLLVAEACHSQVNVADGAIRAPKIAHFCNLEKVAGKPAPKVSVFTLGRLFAEYDNVALRRQWHTFTDEIHQHKNSTVFPASWGHAIRMAVGKAVECYREELESGALSLVMTCIPAKPGRDPRLESFINQLWQEHVASARFSFAVRYDWAILAYLPGALSHHGEHLNATQRFENVRDHLIVSPAANVERSIVVVIDDVVTSGATLYYADKYLRNRGAHDVVCVALAQAIGYSI